VTAVTAGARQNAPSRNAPPMARWSHELVRLVAQRVACPAIDPELGREIERRLWELDEVDAAYAQLSA
jgi:hypothetical protein